MPGGPSAKRIMRSTNVILTPTEIEAQPSTVTDAASAHLYLKKKSLCHATKPYTITHLILVLLQITQISGSIPLPVLTAIRSVVFLLKQHVIDEISMAAAQQIAQTVARQVSDSVTTKLVDHIVATIAPQVAHLLTASEKLENLIEKTENPKTLINEVDQDTDTNPVTPKIIDHITTAMAPQLERLSSTSSSLSKSLEEATKIYWKLDEQVDLDHDINAAAERITNTTDTICSAIKDCHNSINLLSASLKLTQESINTTIDPTGHLPTCHIKTAII
ncbi:uncharacterized protein F5147DRAFT_647611 [Suillus discolor]|uniref:Uncharacterized protein n=1 Tax=Suillus discolor TaxID=1912936 RepID=A0A9P7FIQ8_9AGAM|nr:uncharacterized protein F5147DRAFT_647611 [Suillus discolor]KAG2119714.1 hypothetical protein F5147DRAFT_647611 [Suillus discolor]